MYEDGLAIIFVVFYVCLLLYFILFPKKKLGILNLLFGAVGIIVSVGSLTLDNFPFAPFTNLLVALLSCVCLLVGDKELL